MHENNCGPDEQSSAPDPQEDEAGIINTGTPIQEPKRKTYAHQAAQGIRKSVRTLLRWQNLFAGVVAIAAIGQYWINKKQWETANRILIQNERMIVQMAAQTSAAKDSADADKMAAEIAKGAREDSASSSELSMRPFIHIEGVEISKDLKAGDEVEAQFWLVNSGKTPGRIEGYGSLIDGPYISIDGVARFEKPVRIEASDILLPSTIGADARKRIVFFKEKPITAALLSQISSRQRTIYITGKLNLWSPVFSKQYESLEFCFYYDPSLGRRFGGCQDDQQQKNQPTHH